MRKIAILLTLFVFASWQMLSAQTSVVTGTVTSADDGNTLPGVSVMVKGTTIGISSDMDGKYEIKVPENAVLIFASLGYQDLEVVVGKQKIINVVLKSSNVQLEEVVVTAIGIKRESKALGYSVTEIKSDALDQSRPTNVVNALSGKVAGVRVNNSSGAAGSSSFVEIRGSSSITGNNQPLWVVDGMPIQTGGGGAGDAIDGVATSNRAIDINPDDIASMTVLKGGAATALYGLRAANGAIVITTKKGGDSKGKLNINVNASVSFDQISQVPELQNKYAQGYGSYQGPLGNGNRTFSWGPLVSDLRYVTDPNYVGQGGLTNAQFISDGWSPNGHIVPASTTGVGLSASPIDTYDRYAFFQTGVTQNYSVNMSKATENSSLYVSYTNNYQKAVIPNNDFGKNTFTFNGNTKLNDKLTVGASATYTNSGGNRIQQGSNTSGVMLGLLRTPATFDNSFGYKFANGKQRAYRGNTGYDNPYWTANENSYEDVVNRLIGNINLNLEATSWLSFIYRLGTDWYSESVRDHIAINSNANKTGLLNRSNSFSQDINSDLLMIIKKEFTKDLRMDLTLGQNMYQSEFNSTSATASGYLMSGWANMNNTANNLGYESNFKKRTAAYFGDLALSYKSMLYMSLTGRYEWSTTMPEDKNSFFYPSVSLGFVFSELSMLKDNSILSFGKLRASYASIANDATAYSTTVPYETAAAGDGWTDGITFPFNGSQGFTQSSSAGSANLEPEQMNNFEIGADMRFMDNRFRLDVAYFNNKNEKLLLYVPVAGSSGISSSYMNAGSMETDGFEILLNATMLKTSDFNWDITLNWSNPNTMVTKLANGVDNVMLGGFTEPQVRAIVGQPYRSIYGLAWKRSADGQLLISDGTDASGTPAGFPIQDDDVKLLGNVQPDWTMGITNTFTYKGFTLSALLDIKHGGQMWNGTRGALDYFGTSKGTENRYEDYVFEGVHADGSANSTVVNLDEAWRTDWYGSGFTGPSEDYVEKSNWVRLREVSISYTFSPKFLKKTFINNLNIYAVGNNLWLSTPYSGVDPETSLTGSSNAQGFDYFNMPGTKGCSFGVKIGF